MHYRIPVEQIEPTFASLCRPRNTAIAGLASDSSAIYSFPNVDKSKFRQLQAAVFQRLAVRRVSGLSEPTDACRRANVGAHLCSDDMRRFALALRCRLTVGIFHGDAAELIVQNQMTPFVKR